MVRIGIVDDEKESRQRLREEIARFETEYGMGFEVREFDSALHYLSEQDNACDILFLDIDMPQMSGMELAEKIRETDTEVILIFCTNLQQFALNGYKVSALGFLVKPVQWYSFHMYLLRALKAIQKRDSLSNGAPERKIAVKNGTGMELIDTTDVEYVEVRKHYLLYHLKDKETGQRTVIQTRGTMQEAVGRLAPYGFARCGASFLVNLSHITAVSRMEVRIGQESLPIGRTYRDTFTKEFSRYLAKRGWGDPC